MPKTVLAFVGMPGAGKSVAVSYLKNKGIPFIRFGQFTDEGIKKHNLELTPDNERLIREKYRKELGMSAYAIMSIPKINEILQKSDIVALDGLYSWEEYVLLKNEFPSLILIQIYAEPPLRYKRLENRKIRPLQWGKSKERDIAELEKLNKGGPIAIADYCIINDENIEFMYKQIDLVLKKQNIKL